MSKDVRINFGDFGTIVSDQNQKSTVNDKPVRRYTGLGVIKQPKVKELQKINQNKLDKLMSECGQISAQIVIDNKKYLYVPIQGLERDKANHSKDNSEELKKELEASNYKARELEKKLNNVSYGYDERIRQLEDEISSYKYKLEVDLPNFLVYNTGDKLLIETKFPENIEKLYKFLEDELSETHLQKIMNNSIFADNKNIKKYNINFNMAISLQTSDVKAVENILNKFSNSTELDELEIIDEKITQDDYLNPDNV